jgi:hypothetical protein
MSSRTNRVAPFPISANNSQRPKSLPGSLKSSSRLSIQRPKSLPVISKRTFSTPKQPHLIYSPSKSTKSTNSPLYSAMRSPPPAAKIKPVHHTDLSPREALLPQKHPLNLVAIYYIELLYTIIYSISNNIADILKRINDTDYMQPQLFKKTAIERLIALQKNILKEEYEYDALDGSTINIKNRYSFISFLLKKTTVAWKRDFYRNLRIYLKEMKYSDIQIEIKVRKIFNATWDIEEDKKLQDYIERNIITKKVKKNIINMFNNINLVMITNKLNSQFKMIEELINILNDIWVDEKTKNKFYKFVLKTQKPTGIQSGGMLKFVSSRFMRSNRVLQEPEQQAPMNMRARTGRTQQIIKLYKSMQTRANSVLPEEVLDINMYWRLHTTNFKNIYDYISLIKSYLFEEDEELIRVRYEKKLEKKIARYNKRLIRDDEKEYLHLNKKIIVRLKEPIHKEKSVWTLSEEFKNFDKEPVKKKNYLGKKIDPIPTFSELNKKSEILIPLKLKKFKEVRFQHIQFHTELNIKYISDRINQVENYLSELLPIRINSLA